MLGEIRHDPYRAQLARFRPLFRGDGVMGARRRFGCIYPKPNKKNPTSLEASYPVPMWAYEKFADMLEGKKRLSQRFQFDPKDPRGSPGKRRPTPRRGSTRRSARSTAAHGSRRSARPRGISPVPSRSRSMRRPTSRTGGSAASSEAIRSTTARRPSIGSTSRIISSHSWAISP